jgi:hypothetical protein
VSLAIALFTSLALAQPSDPEIEARDLFGRALEALRTGDHAGGRELLERSLALYDAAPTRFNLAITYRATGDPLRSVTMLEEMLEGRHGELSADQRAGVSEQLALSLAEIAFLAVRVRGAKRATVIVDGEERGVTDRGALAVRVNPGTHTVAIETDLRSDAIETRVGRGERAIVDIDAPTRPTAPILPDDPIEEEGGPHGRGRACAARARSCRRHRPRGGSPSRARWRRARRRGPGA